MSMVRTGVMAAALALVPTVAWAQTTTSAPTPTTTEATTTTIPATTTTTAAVTRIEDLVCSEPVNQVATCVDPQGRVVLRVDDLSPTTTTTTVRPVPPVRPSGGVPLALTG